MCLYFLNCCSFQAHILFYLKNYVGVVGKIGSETHFHFEPKHQHLIFSCCDFRQLISITELFCATEVSQYVLPLGLALCEDRVSEVRRMAFRLVGTFLCIGEGLSLIFIFHHIFLFSSHINQSIFSLICCNIMASFNV